MPELMIKEDDTGPIVLVVEDVEEIRDGIEQLLKVDGYRVDAARDERDAVLRARRERPNLILVS
jgi:CheY-like chemotaxis protein